MSAELPRQLVLLLKALSLEKQQEEYNTSFCSFTADAQVGSNFIFSFEVLNRGSWNMTKPTGKQKLSLNLKKARVVIDYSFTITDL